MKNNTMEQIINRIKNRRIELDLSYQDLADITKISKSTLQRYETGKIESIPISKLEVLAAGLQVTPDWIMGWVTDNNENDFYINSIDNILPLPKTKTIPLLGKIACGEPILAIENADEFLKIPINIDADFALECKGDSMINARINDGDIVYVKSQSDVENGQIAVVLIEDEATPEKSV